MTRHTRARTKKKKGIINRGSLTDMKSCLSIRLCIMKTNSVHPKLRRLNDYHDRLFYRINVPTTSWSGAPRNDNRTYRRIEVEHTIGWWYLVNLLSWYPRYVYISHHRLRVCTKYLLPLLKDMCEIYIHPYLHTDGNFLRKLFEFNSSSANA